MITRLNLDEREALTDLLQHEGLRPLLKELEAQTECLERDVLRFNLETGDERQLAFLKSRGEGARKLQKAFVAALEKFRLASLQASDDGRQIKK